MKTGTAARRWVAAALCALRLCPGAEKALLASHVSAEPAGQRLLDAAFAEMDAHWAVIQEIIHRKRPPLLC